VVARGCPLGAPTGLLPHGHPNHSPRFVHTKGCSVQSQDRFAVTGTFLGPFCSLYGTAQHKMLPGSWCCLETPLVCNTISGRGVYNFICSRSGWRKPSETASGSGLTFAKFCMKYQFSSPFI